MQKRLPTLCAAIGIMLSVAFWMNAMGVSAVISTAAHSDTTIELPILMYHHILKEESKHNKYTISPDDFAADLAYLQSEGYTCILVQDLIDYVDNGVPLPEKPIIITFDDGYESFFVYAYPLLEKYKAKAVFSVVGRYTDQYSQTSDHHVAYSHCTWEQLYTMQSSGLVEIQNHSYNLHSIDGPRKGAKPIPGESQSDYAQALSKDLSQLQNTAATFLNQSPTAFTYPFGYVHKDALPILKSLGFRAIFTCEEKLNHLSGEPEELYQLHRINRPHGKTAAELLSSVT